MMDSLKNIGEYCANPDPSVSAPEPLIETLPNSRTATMRKTEQDDIRSTLLATINGCDVLTQATSPVRATSPAPERPRDTAHDSPPTTPKRAPPPRNALCPRLATLLGSPFGQEEDDIDSYEDSDSADQQKRSQGRLRQATTQQPPPHDEYDNFIDTPAHVIEVSKLRSYGRPPPIIIDGTWGEEYFTDYHMTCTLTD